jgi:hypothetical protein
MHFVNNELGNMWKEAAVAYLETILCHFSVGSRQRHEYTSGCSTGVMKSSRDVEVDCPDLYLPLFPSLLSDKYWNSALK